MYAGLAPVSVPCAGSPNAQAYEATVPSGSDDVEPSNVHLPVTSLHDDVNTAEGALFGNEIVTGCVPNQ